MLGGVVGCELLGKGIFLTLILARGIDIVESADAAQSEPFKGYWQAFSVPKPATSPLTSPIGASISRVTVV